MSIGPIQAFVIGFPSSDRFEGKIAAELDKLREAGAIRVVDALVVVNRGDDSIMARTSDLTAEDRAEMGAVLGALVGLGLGGAEGAAAGATAGAEMASAPGREERGKRLASAVLEDLPEGSAALILVIEHRWAIPLRDAVREAGGLLLAHHSISAEEMVALGVAMGEDA